MVINAKYVYWFDEELEQYYGDDNNGFVHGIYVYGDDDDQFPMEVQWYKTEAQAREALLTI